MKSGYNDCVVKRRTLTKVVNMSLISRPVYMPEGWSLVLSEIPHCKSGQLRRILTSASNTDQVVRHKTSCDGVDDIVDDVNIVTGNIGIPNNTLNTMCWVLAKLNDALPCLFSNLLSGSLRKPRSILC